MLYKKKQKYKYTLQLMVTIPNFSLSSWSGLAYLGYFLSIEDGKLRIREGYSWNGANFILDTKKNMYPSLIHDCLYQIIEKKERGVNRFFCWCYSKALKWFGKNSLKGNLYCE